MIEVKHYWAVRVRDRYLADGGFMTRHAKRALLWATRQEAQRIAETVPGAEPVRIRYEWDAVAARRLVMPV